MTTREWDPGELLEISGFFWKTCVLQTAVKMDVFTVFASAMNIQSPNDSGILVGYV